MHDNMNKEAWEIFKSIMYGSIKKENPLKGWLSILETEMDIHMHVNFS